MSDDNFPPLQVSIFLGPDRYTAPQLVVRSNNITNLLDHFNDLADTTDPTDEDAPTKLDVLIDHLAQIEAAGKLKFGMAQLANASAGTPAAGGFSSDGFTPNVPSSNTPRCKHGDMKFKSGTNASGKAYSGHFCTSFNRQDQCPPVWDK